MSIEMVESVNQKVIPTPSQEVDYKSLDQMVAQSLKKGSMTPEVMMKWLEFKREIKKDEAKELFNQAVCNFKKIQPPVKQSNVVTNRKGSILYKYAGFNDIQHQYNPILAEFGLFVSFEGFKKNDGNTTITAVLEHIKGESKKVSITVATPKVTDMNNATQQDGSAITYAKRYAICGLLGISFISDNDGKDITPDPKPKNETESKVQNKLSIRLLQVIKEARKTGVDPAIINQAEQAFKQGNDEAKKSCGIKLKQEIDRIKVAGKNGGLDTKNPSEKPSVELFKINQELSKVIKRADEMGVVYKMVERAKIALESGSEEEKKLCGRELLEEMERIEEFNRADKSIGDPDMMPLDDVPW